MKRNLVQEEDPMHKKNDLVALALALLVVGLSILACTLNQEGKPQPTRANTGSPRISFSGTGTDTWSWEQGKYTCDTKDEMLLTINEYNEAVLTARGGCLSLSYVGDPAHYESGACEQLNPANKCALVVYGTYDEDNQEVTFKDCNTPKSANASGNSMLFNKPTGWVVSGEVSCSFSNSDEQHTLIFTMP
jgi:hypothetical protein